MADLNSTLALLDRLAKGPKPFAVVYRYADGNERCVPCHSRAAAESHLEGNKRRIGRDLISRETGKTVRIVSLTIEPN